MNDLKELQRPELSFVVPVVERVGDLAQLFSEYSSEATRLGMSCEFIFVVDSRQREVIPALRELQKASATPVTLLLLTGQFGESTSLMLGWKQAQGKIIVTLASYFQVDPAGLGPAVEKVKKGKDLVVGIRSPRRDSWFNRLQTRVFHALVGAMTETEFSDISCGFRVLSRQVASELNVYGGLHRFVPLLASRHGFEVAEIEVPQRDEDVRTRYYGAAVYLKRLLDILTVFFLLKFTKRPLRFFGVVGFLLSSVGFVITSYLGVYRILQIGPIGDRPLLLLGVMLIVLGVQTLSLGLVGEIIVFTHARELRDYRIAEIIQGGELRSTGDDD